MYFQLSEEQEMMRKMVREFALEMKSPLQQEYGMKRKAGIWEFGTS